MSLSLLTLLVCDTKASSDLDDISVSYQWSSDLINWNESGVSDSDGTTITIVPTDNSPTVGTTTATAIISAEALKKYSSKYLLQTSNYK